MAMARPTMVVLSASEMPLAMTRGSVPRGAVAQRREDRDQARDRAEQAEQRRDADDDLEDDEPAFEPHDLVPGARLHGLDVLGLRPLQMLQADVDDARERGGVVPDEAQQFCDARRRRRRAEAPRSRSRCSGGMTTLRRRAKPRTSMTATRHHRADHQRNHEHASLEEEVDHRFCRGFVHGMGRLFIAEARRGGAQFG